MGIAGALMGTQIGILWLQREYMKMDPEGKLMAELKEIGNELRDLQNIENQNYNDDNKKDY